MPIPHKQNPSFEFVPVAMRPEKVNKNRPWGYKGAMTLPADHATRKPYTPHTPFHWVKVSIQQNGETFALRHAITMIPISKTILKLAKFHDGVPLEGMTKSDALYTGQRLEEALRVLK
jgi:hypothetical protein